MNERSFSLESGESKPEGERARVSFLRMSLRKLTEVSRSREEGGISSAGSSSGISFPLSPDNDQTSISTWVIKWMIKAHGGRLVPWQRGTLPDSVCPDYRHQPTSCGTSIKSDGSLVARVETDQILARSFLSRPLCPKTSNAVCPLMKPVPCASQALNI